MLLLLLLLFSIIFMSSKILISFMFCFFHYIINQDLSVRRVDIFVCISRKLLTCTKLFFSSIGSLLFSSSSMTG